MAQGRLQSPDFVPGWLWGAGGIGGVGDHHLSVLPSASAPGLTEGRAPHPYPQGSPVRNSHCHSLSELTRDPLHSYLI